MTVAMEAPSQIFRIEGIPSGTPLEALESFFADVDRPSIIPKSLAVSHQHNSQQSVATVTFASDNGTFRYPRLNTTSTKLTIDDDFEGLTVFSSPNDHQADVIAVSDLFEHPFYSWASSADRAWLRDSLPRDVPAARVMLYGHDVELHSEKGLLEACAETFLRRLTAAIPETSSAKPIILLGYRTGCLVIEKALSMAKSQANHALAEKLAMVVFFDASHSGLPEEFLNLLPDGKSKIVITNELREGSDTLRQLDVDFAHNIGTIPVIRCISRVNYQEIDYMTTWKPSRTIVHEGRKETVAHLRRTHMGQYHQILEEIRRSLGSEAANGVTKAPDSFIHFSRPGRLHSPLSSPTSGSRRRDSILGTPETSPKVQQQKPPPNSRYNGYDVKPLPKPPSRRSSTTLPKSVLQSIANAAASTPLSTPDEADALSPTALPIPPESTIPGAKHGIHEASLPSPPLSASPIPPRPHIRTSSISSQAIPKLKALLDDHDANQSTKDCMEFQFAPFDITQKPLPRASSSLDRYEDQVFVPRIPNQGTLLKTKNSITSIRRNSIFSTTSGNSLSQPTSPKTSLRPSLNRATTLPTILARPFKFKRALTSSSSTSTPTTIPAEPLESSEESIRLFAAIDSNDLDYIRDLLRDQTTAKSTLRLTAPDGTGNTILHHAVLAANLPLAKLLLAPSTKPKPKVNARNAAKQTPLHLAALYDNVEIIRMLCDVHVDANKNAVDGEGNTPLMVAARQGTLEAVMSLCRNGASVVEKRWDGRRAVDIAKGRMARTAGGVRSPGTQSLDGKERPGGIHEDGMSTGGQERGRVGGQWKSVVKYLDWREKQDITVAWPGLF